MRNLFIFVALLLFGVSLAHSQTKAITGSQDKVKTELRKLERDWLDAYLNKDVAAMRRIVADDFIITYSDGSVRDKAETIRRLSLGPKNSNEYHWTEDSVVRIYGDAAIITGTFLYRMRSDGEETVSKSRYTDTYIRRNGRWQVVASHLSKIEVK